MDFHKGVFGNFNIEMIQRFFGQSSPRMSKDDRAHYDCPIIAYHNCGCGSLSIKLLTWSSGSFSHAVLISRNGCKWHDAFSRDVSLGLFLLYCHRQWYSQPTGLVRHVNAFSWFHPTSPLSLAGWNIRRCNRNKEWLLRFLFHVRRRSSFSPWWRTSPEDPVDDGSIGVFVRENYTYRCPYDVPNIGFLEVVDIFSRFFVLHVDQHAVSTGVNNRHVPIEWSRRSSRGKHHHLGNIRRNGIEGDFADSKLTFDLFHQCACRERISKHKARQTSLK